MNYLAHLCLSFDDPDIMLGNFIADNISAKESATLSDDVLRGVYLHRKIDSYTDSHSSFLQSVELFKANHGRYATVIIDILHDHFLCHNWNDLMNQSFHQFEQQVYSEFESAIPTLSAGSHKRHVQSLLKYRYLHVYQSKDGMLGVMKRMDVRTRFESDFQEAVHEMYEHYNMLNMNFIELYTGLTDALPEMWQSVVTSYPSK